MIFKQMLVDQILAGTKTQTRRPVNFENPRSPFWHERPRPQVGGTFRAQANYKPGQSWPLCEVTGLRRERINEITEADARAEGFLPERGDHSARAYFLWGLAGMYPDLDLASECWVWEFKLLAAASTREGEGQ